MTHVGVSELCRHWPPLVQIMPCRLSNITLLFEPTMLYCAPDFPKWKGVYGIVSVCSFVHSSIRPFVLPKLCGPRNSAIRPIHSKLSLLEPHWRVQVKHHGHWAIGDTMNVQGRNNWYWNLVHRTRAPPVICLLSVGALGRDFIESQIKIRRFSFNKIDFGKLSFNWRSFGFSRTVLRMYE